ncbi:MAG TPA: dTDP-4-dehydrorhamnose reductase [Leucothrix mucor]|nr:dTDP-4-dehydrorhamnose reductase [Leucothrix mucor]
MCDKNKKVLITGADGQLGFELQRTVPNGYECIVTDKDNLDITDADAVNAFISNQKPDVIINSAAYTAVDKAEEEVDLATAINATGAENLAQACKDNNIQFMQISTDFVFDGKGHTPYLVDSPAKPEGMYGITKQKGDELVQQILGDDAFIIRTSWLYSAHGNNFVKTMLRFMAEREELSIIADQIGTPTWANSLAQAVWVAVENNVTGMHHWSDAGVASWYDFAYAIMEEGVALGLLDKTITLNAITTADYPTPASRPCYSVMDKTTTWKALDKKSEHWRVALRQMMSELV